MRDWGVRAWFLVVMAACGRLDFDSVDHSSLGDGATGDATEIGMGPGSGSGTTPVTLTGVYLISGDGVNPTSVLTLDLATGDVAVVGTIAAGAGFLGGLALWDANTLYATGNGKLIEITLAPFGAHLVATITTDQIAGLETEAPYLTAVDATTSTLVIYTRSNFATPPTTKPLGIPLLTGDIAQASYALGAYYFSNSNHTLYSVYTATGNSTVTGAVPSVGTVAGMFSVNNYTQYYVTSSDLDEVIPIDITNGATGAAIPLCHPCPSTHYDLLDGDAASVP